MAERAPLLEVQGISLAFGGLSCLDRLDLVVGEGEIVSVIGPNGAGKTTLFNVITGVYPPEEGEILFEGQSILGLDPHQIARRGIARTFQTLRLFLNMTVKENVMAAAYGHTKAGVLRSVLRTPGMRREEREIEQLAEERLAFFGDRLVGYRWRQPAYSLSLREPPPARDRACDRREAEAPAARRAGRGHEPGRDARDDRAHRATAEEGGYTILVIEHDMHVVEGISDRVVALDHGIKIAEGSFGAGRDRSQGGRGVPGNLGHGAEVTEHERNARAAAPARGHQHLLRPDAHPPGRQPPGRARASSSASSAGMPPGSPPR